MVRDNNCFFALIKLSMASFSSPWGKLIAGQIKNFRISFPLIGTKLPLVYSQITEAFAKLHLEPNLRF
jgi:hypothetical protein